MSLMQVSTTAPPKAERVFHKERKRSKKKERVRGSLWKLPQLWKSAEKRGFPQLLGKASQNPLGFPTVTTGPRRLTLTIHLC